MVKVIQPDVPPEYEEFWKKICRWYDLKGVPSFSRLWFQKIRRMKKIRYEISRFRTVASAWENLSAAQRVAWDSAAQKAWEYNRGYRMFTADLIYRMVLGLSIPGDPSDYHQLFGIKMSNPGGSENIFFRRDDKDLVGQLTYKFSYKKDEITPGGWQGFQVTAMAYYFNQGNIAFDTDVFTAPAGNVGWTTIEHTFGTTDRLYFHFKIIFSIESYDAEVYLNDLIQSDQNGQYFKENFITTRYKAWTPTRLLRKQDWVFNPPWPNDYFEHLYLT